MLISFFTCSCLIMLFPRHWFIQRTKTFSTAPSSDTVSYTRDFTLWPSFLSLIEQRVLLTTCLRKLDCTDSTQTRRRRKAYGSTIPTLSVSTNALQDLFCPDHYYDFQKVAFNYEMLLLALQSVLSRVITMESYTIFAK